LPFSVFGAARSPASTIFASKDVYSGTSLGFLPSFSRIARSAACS